MFQAQGNSLVNLRLSTALALILAMGAAPAMAQDTAVSGSVTTETGTATDLSVEQQTELRTIITEAGVEPVAETDFDVSVGAVVPDGIVLKPLPAGIAGIAPAYDGYLFFLLADGRIAVVHPDTLEIVLVITA